MNLSFILSLLNRQNGNHLVAAFALYNIKKFYTSFLLLQRNHQFEIKLSVLNVNDFEM